MYGRVRLTASSVVHEVPPATKDVYQTCVSVQIAELRVNMNVMYVRLTHVVINFVVLSQSNTVYWGTCETLLNASFAYSLACLLASYIPQMHTHRFWFRTLPFRCISRIRNHTSLIH